MTTDASTAEPVERFLHAYWAGDVYAALAACTPGFVWLNTALPKQRLEGHEQLRAMMVDLAGGFPEPIETGSGGHRTVTWATRGDEVLHERVDFWTLRGKRMELACCATWVVEDGLVAEWRDYYDIGAFLRQLAEVGIEMDTSAWW
ncbi:MULTISPECIES: limonene-1,2-epoxide hydrolase family protein [unclassified Frankia]|uniref:limonene-1,2-epoxide hydrolase family protein n=1 Tax=unclassified Frankia TaxID=2632575 RepID=UPI002AD2E0D0|nr:MULTISPECIES: limonene-1,2-epoxide hydrolase family protein [unclassified Frankia]